ncbi:MAG: DNA-binding transcriptional regulator OxyR [Gammaproteobacteria bacterium]|nr:DNA-binding transcriptional regulator OxyR [Gammaproteobacteria bacterium]
MNLRDLQYLVSVHNCKSFSRAANECFVSQPTLSGQIKKLEEQLGSSLIERSTRKVLFTPLGEDVVRHAKDILRSVDKIQSVVQSHGDPMAGEFHIGLIPTIGPFLLPLIMPGLGELFPQTKLFLYELRTQDLLQQLQKGEIDAAILARLNWVLPYDQIDLYHEPMQLAVSKDDCLLDSIDEVCLEHLDNRRVLMLEDGHCLRDQALDVCFSAGAREDNRFRATSMDTLLHMVATGTGMTLIPDLATRTRVQGVRFIRFKDPAPNREIVMLTRKNCPRTDALLNIARHISQTVSSL